MASYVDIAGAYEAERDKYEALVGRIDCVLRQELRNRGIYFELSGRAKEVMSFVKKALREGYSDPLTEIGDKAGLRVIVPYLQDVSAIEQAVGSVCVIDDREQKLDALAYDELGYLGVHLAVRARPEVLVGRPDLGEDRDDLAQLPAELQIHSKAQSAWSVVSHDLLYKPPVEASKRTKRSITRLVALVELFDGEVDRLRTAVEGSADFAEMAVAAEIDDLLVRFTGRRPDRKLSALSVPALVSLYDCPVAEIRQRFLDPYVQANEDKLRAIYAAYDGDTGANPLLCQPEALMIFERLEVNRDQLKAVWPVDRLDMDLLEGMATIAGVDI